MTQASLTGTHGAKPSQEIPLSDPEIFDKGSAICRVTHLTEYCRLRHGDSKKACGRGLVRIELENGAQTTVHDDGSFIDWTGESNQ